MAITHKRLFRGECVPNDGDVLRKLGDLQRGFASSEHVTVHLSPRSLARSLPRQSAEGATMFSTKSSSSCSPISVPRTFSFRSLLFMLPLAAAVASDRDVEGETRILLSTRRGQSQWEGVREGALFLFLSLQRLCFCQCHVLISSSRCSRPETFLAQSFFSSLFEGRKQMDQGRNVDPYIMGTRMRICWFNKGNSSFLIPSNIIDGNHFVPIFSQRQARWIALSISRNLGSWLEPRERHVCGRRCRWFSWSFSVSLLHARRRASLSLRLSCSSPVPASPKTDAAPLSPSMRNRAPSTRIGAARDPGAVPAQSPLALPPSLLRPDGVPEVKRKEELDGGEAQGRTDCTAERRKDGRR